MSWLREIARPDIQALRAYEHAVWEPGLVRLHANELPWRTHGDGSDAGLNRYPEPHPYQLTEALAKFYEVPPAMLLAGRGSDELIDLLMRSYCQAGHDAIIVCPPTFGMYSVAARIQGASVLELPLQRAEGWRLDADAIAARVEQAGGAVKLVFLCSPNNPTGNRLDPQAMIGLARALHGRALLVIDEAYADFAPGTSFIPRVSELAGLVVLRTLSKAHGLAGARCGLAIAHQEVISLLRKVIQPYAITQLTIEAVLAALQPAALAQTALRIATLREERTRLARALESRSRVRRVWPSEANFLLVEFIDAGEAIAHTRAAGLLLRDLRRTPGLEQTVRITVGSPEQNDRLLESLP